MRGGGSKSSEVCATLEACAQSREACPSKHGAGAVPREVGVLRGVATIACVGACAGAHAAALQGLRSRS